MEYRYDVVIIGAGPAGSACALELLKRGISPCLIDKAVFPRHKTCAGLVTEKTYRLISYLFGEKNTDALFCDRASRIKLFHKKELLTSAPLKREVRFVDRSVFDNALVNEYQAFGGLLRQGEKKLSVDYENDRVLLSNGDVIHYRFLIHADGALSPAHKLTGSKKNELCFCTEAFIPAERFRLYSVKLYYGYVREGYLWAFPHGDTVCIGAGSSYKEDCDYRDMLSAFFSDFGIDTDDVRMHGAFLPYGTVVPQKRLPDNVMLAGDAGGFTDPITGEGLYMAMMTGILAARAMTSLRPKEVYLRAVEPIARIVRDGKKTQKLFYAPPIQKEFFKKVKRRDKLLTFYFDSIVSEYRYGYRDLPRLFYDYKNRRKRPLPTEK